MKHINPAIVLAQFFHNTYEQLAPCSGYETRADTKLFDPASTNGRLMTAVCGRVMMLFAGVLIIAVAVSGLTGYGAERCMRRKVSPRFRPRTKACTHF